MAFFFEYFEPIYIHKRVFDFEQAFAASIALNIVRSFFVSFLSCSALAAMEGREEVRKFWSLPVGLLVEIYMK